MRAVFITHIKSDRSSEICMLPSCVHAASEILNNLDPNYEDIDPCTDFDKFICGGWEEQRDLRPDQGDIFTGTLMMENSQMVLRHILEADTSHSLGFLESSADKDNFRKLKDAYDSCMNEEIIKQYGAAPLRSIIKAIEAAFPTSDLRNTNRFSMLHNDEQKGMVSDSGNQLTNTMLYLMNTGVDVLLSIGVSVSISTVAGGTTDVQVGR
jgi:endothelin-converting enzyme